MSHTATLSALLSRAFPLPRLLLRQVCGRSRQMFMQLLVQACALFALCLAPSVAMAGIVTTLPPLAGLVLLLDAEADVRCLLPPGADAHDFQLAPRQVQALKKADLLIRSSYDDGHWAGIALPGHSLDMWPEHSHAWLSPATVRAKLPELAAALQRLAPNRSEQIADALQQAEEACNDFDKAWRQALAPYRDHGVIMQHNAWQPALRDYGVPVWSVLESSHQGDAIRPHRLEEALALLRAHPGAILWGNHRHTNRGLQWLQQHSGQKTRLLYADPLGDCGQTWAQLMQANLDMLGHFPGKAVDR